MNKVLIIDDEILTIKYLKSLHSWEDFDCGNIFHAVTIARALDCFKREKPQIVFVDVRMPGMDGLELSRRLLEKNPDVCIVIMTAYQEFDYVKEALQIGIKYFLVKHEITEEKLRETLEKIFADFWSKRRYEQVMWNDWLRKIWDGERAESMEKPNGSVCILAMLTLFGLSALMGNGEPARLEESKVRELFFNSIRIRAFSRLNPYTYALVCEYEKPSSEKESYEELSDFTKQLGESCRMDVGLQPVFFLSSFYESYEELGEVCSSFKKFSGCVFSGRESVVREDMLPTFEKLVPEKLWPERAPKEWEQPDIEAVLFKLDAARYYMEMEDMVRLRQYIHARIPLSFLQKEDKEVLIICLKQLLRACLRYLEHAREQDTAGNKMVQQTLSYIHAHYMDDITSSVIAEKLRVSDGYLRLLFKRETGSTVKDYILHYRIERAKRLLLENKKKNYEIAAECGFASSQHFSRVFRQITGTTPGEFKQQDGSNTIETENYRF